jgi:hypothetical protein
MKLNSIRSWMERNLETEGDLYHGFKDYEVKRMERDIAWMQEPLSDVYVNSQKADFYRFFNESDKRHGTNFLKTFPEMSNWWNECKRCSYE